VRICLNSSATAFLAMQKFFEDCDCHGDRGVTCRACLGFRVSQAGFGGGVEEDLVWGSKWRRGGWPRGD
jgi:hypothetical protein